MIRRATALLCCLVVSVLLGGCAAWRPDVLGAPTPPADETRIAFGSCARQDQPQPIWDAVMAADPHLFIFAGDNIYGDTTDMAVLRRKYAELAAQPGFQRLAGSVPILATWDDHDYGADDAGADYPMRAESQQVFLDFWGVPEDSPRRRREGIYHSETFGEDGRRVQVILLDTRYHRLPLVRNPQPPTGGAGPYAPTTDGTATILGDDQWRWLHEQLQQPADVRLIVSSIQVVAGEHGWETWANFPAEREHLLSVLRDTKANGVVVLSGDRHHGELSKLPAEEGTGYPLYDLTASALNQAKGPRDEANRYRVGDVYFKPHFGLVTVQWSADSPTVRLEVRSGEGAAISEAVPLSNLRAQQ